MSHISSAPVKLSQPMVPPLPFDPIAEASRQWRTHWGDDAVPSMAAVTSLMRVHQIVMARLNDLLKPWDLTFPRYEALVLLSFSRSGSLPLGKIGARLQVHPTSVTNTIDGLERLGLVRREPHEHDRRTTLATITDRGRATAGAATQVLNDAQFGTEPLTAGDLEVLADVLRRMRVDAGDFS
jgi:DNA-binding MarR family transcriptional regulator